MLTTHSMWIFIFKYNSKSNKIKNIIIRRIKLFFIIIYNNLRDINYEKILKFLIDVLIYKKASKKISYLLQ